MAKMKCPYNEMQLRIALMNLDKKVEEIGEDKFAGIMNRVSMNQLPEDKAGQNKLVAESNGIDVATLINSPNYETLMLEYKQGLLLKSIGEMEERLGVDNKTAWAIVVAGMGGLD